MARLARDPEVEALIDVYRADLIAAGHFAANEVTSPARAFLLRVGGAAGWSRLSVEEQWRVSQARESAVVMWMIAAGHVRPRPEFLVRGYQPIGKVSAWVHREFHERFMATAAGLGLLAEGGRVAVVGGRQGRDGRGRGAGQAHTREVRYGKRGADRCGQAIRRAFGADHV